MNNKLVLFLLVLARKRNQKGYAMLFTTIITIFLLVLVAAATTFADIGKSRTNALVDGSSSFYVAESALNRRASELKQILNKYSGVIETGNFISNNNSTINDCFSEGISASSSVKLVGCRNYEFRSSNNTARVISGANISLGGGSDENKYIGYTSVTSSGSTTNSIPSTDDYGGLNAIEQKYTISAIAKKPIFSDKTVYAQIEATEVEQKVLERSIKLPGDDQIISAYKEKRAAALQKSTAKQGADASSSSTELSVSFINRIVPLFQFGIFYNNDFELNATSSMDINGWVHSNANVYIQPAGVGSENPITTFLDRISAVGKIYNRVDAWSPGVGRVGTTRVSLDGKGCSGSNCQNFEAYDGGKIDPISLKTSSGSDLFDNKKVLDDSIALKTPPVSIARKRNYADNTIGEYFSKADLRLEMVPDRDVTSKGTTPWTRDEKIIPFNLTSVKTTGLSSDVCSTTFSVGSDPSPSYVDPNREGISSLKCHVFSKGELQSLRQPVMVLTNLNQSNSLRASENIILGIPNLSGLTLPVLETKGNNDITKVKIVRALQIALVSSPNLVHLDNLDTVFSDGIYDSSNNGSLGDFKDTFEKLLIAIGSDLSSEDRDNLLKAKPNEIAALSGAWFLPAPVQRIDRPKAETNSSDNANYPNLRNSGFYDGQERRWISLLQTNLASLSVWNRDGVYVDPIGSSMRTQYKASSSAIETAFNRVNDGTGNLTRGLVYDIQPSGGSKGLQAIGLGSFDTTEGGHIFHATVTDDLDGNGTIDSNDISIDTDKPIYKKNLDNTDYQDPTSTNTDKRVVIDYLRKYPGSTLTRKSPFAFAFNGGNYLFNALTIASDRPVYIQGDYNNNGVANPEFSINIPSPTRFPASVIGDTVTVLSNQCATSVSDSSNNFLGMPLGQLKCGLPPSIEGTETSYDPVSSAISINAAFLANTPISNGNKGVNRYDGVEANLQYSGGANNYIRLLEDWNNNDNPYSLNYLGSLISLGSTLEYSGKYSAGGGSPSDFAYYNIPLRNITYDTFFKDLRQLPPLTPKGSYFIQSSFSRKY